MRLVDATARQRGFGDYYGYCLVAAGKAEIYAEADLKAVGRRADEDPHRGGGRRVSPTSQGKPDIYTGSVLASNGLLHDEALRPPAPRLT